MNLKLNKKEEDQSRLSVSVNKEDQKEVYAINLYVDLIEYDYLQRCA